MEIDHEITSCHSPLSADSSRVVVSCKRKYVQEDWLTDPRKKVWLGELTIAVDWDI